jgi:hypothetical protein
MAVLVLLSSVCGSACIVIFPLGSSILISLTRALTFSLYVF